MDLDLDLHEALSTTEIETVLDALHDRITSTEPRVTKVRVDLNSPLP